MKLEHLDIGLENELRSGLAAGNQFFMAYQPKLDLVRGHVVGLEALIRWQHPRRGLVLPDEFIPLAEDTLLINPLGDWVMATVIQQMADWQDGELADMPVAINLSPVQLRDTALPGRAAALCQAHGVAPGQIEFEITETAFIGDFPHASHILTDLKADGFRLSLDDFGTGYSSLNYLATLPLDTLKLAGNFVAGLPDNAKTRAILRAVIAMARELQLDLVVEGVETPEQHKWLRNAGCNIGQGYYYSHPYPADAIREEITQGFPSRPAPWMPRPALAAR